MKRFSLPFREDSSLTNQLALRANQLWFRLRPLVTLLFALGVTSSASAYVLEGQRWFSSTVSIQMNLSATSYHLQSPLAFPLLDGASSWETVYSTSAAIWNQYMAHLQISAYASLDSNTLGLTTYSYDPSTNAMVEADTAFNPAISWNSYRGPLLSSGVIDFRRVAIHELGHILGLDHPDTNGQTVNAIMNSVVSNTDSVTADDIDGVQALYGVPANRAPNVTPANPPPNGSPPALGQRIGKDFNGDGYADLLWEDTPTGDYYIWLMRNGVHTFNIYIGRIPSPWRLAGVGDFNGDGMADLVWENTVTGQRAIWFLNNGVVTSTIFLPTVSTDWHIAGAADFNGDGQADLVWENTVTGERAIWFLNDGVAASTIFLPTIPTQWHIAGAADFNGDRQADLVWENRVTGERAIWFLHSGVLASTVILGTVPTEWEITEH